MQEKQSIKAEGNKNPRSDPKAGNTAAVKAEENGQELYVLRVMTGKEREVWWELRKRGFHSYAPSQEILIRRCGQNRRKRIIYFSGYVFLEIKRLENKDYHEIKKLPYILYFLPKERPEAVSEKEAAYIRLLSCSQKIKAWREQDGSWRLSVEELVPYIDKVLHRAGRIRLHLPLRGEKFTALLPCEIIKST